MKKTLLLLCFAGLSGSLLAQASLDSLYLIWQDQRQADTVRLDAMHNFSRRLMNTNPDSAEILAREELAFAQKIRNIKWQGKALNLIGATYRFRSEYAKALHYFEHSIVLLEQAGDQSSLAAVYGNIGDV